MKARMFLVASVSSYVLFVMTMIYAVAFFGNFLMPRTIDGFAVTPFSEALAVNVSLLCLFALQHSGMARTAFKKSVTRAVPVCLERSLFVFISSVTVIVLMLFWKPMGAIVWSVEPTLLRALITGAYFSGWVLIVWSTFLIDHLSYFGLRQAHTAYRGGICEIPGFQTPGAYRVVRHPIHTGWLIILWAAPTMTVTRLTLATGLTIYILAGTRLAEAGLKCRFEPYAQYVRKVPMLMPSIRRHLAIRRGD